MKQLVKISQVKANPKNPRIIKDHKFKKLVQSIKDFPEMLEKATNSRRREYDSLRRQYAIKSLLRGRTKRSLDRRS
jgi:hypothetical protein